MFALTIYCQQRRYTSSVVNQALPVTDFLLLPKPEPHCLAFLQQQRPSEKQTTDHMHIIDLIVKLTLSLESAVVVFPVFSTNSISSLSSSFSSPKSATTFRKDAMAVA